MEQPKSAPTTTKRKNNPSKSKRNNNLDNNSAGDAIVIMEMINAGKNNPHRVLKAFDQLEKKSLQAYSLAIKAHIALNSLFAALDLWHVMEKDPNVVLRTVSYNKLLQIYFEMRDYAKMKEVYEYIVQHYKPDVETFHRIVMMVSTPDINTVEEVISYYHAL